MPEIRFDAYYRYQEIADFLHQYAKEYPKLVELRSLGKSYEGRDIWMVVLTDRETGPDGEKPGLWIDGNLHAAELAPSTLCLHVLDTWVRGFGSDEEITRCLKTRSVYLCPRANPDGAELALAPSPKILRSGTRAYPTADDPQGVMELEDVDGDGRLLFMRVPDANGAWKISEGEPRLMTLREPTETGGRYYRILPEGSLPHYDGAPIAMAPPKQELDFNRNFPTHWRPHPEQPGAGDYPASEPEVRAICDFIAAHPNIGAAISVHTHSGILLRPFSYQGDEQMWAEDLWAYQTIGAKGTEITGYPNVSIYHGFRYHPNQEVTGAFDEWMYEQRGCFAWTVELWCPQRKAGAREYKPIEWYRRHSLDDERIMLEWSDRQLDGQAYVDWYPFEHPQLGPVELGGWDFLFGFRNPPPQYLEEEIAPFARWFAWHALIAPELGIREATSERVDEATYRVRMVVQNQGWLPTSVTRQAEERELVGGLCCTIELPQGARLLQGHPRLELGQLAGRSHHPSFLYNRRQVSTSSDLALAEWLVHAPKGGVVQLCARHPRAGVVRSSLAL